MLSSTPLAVTQFTADASGFTVRFNQAVDASILNLYDTEAGTLGPSDITVVGTSHGGVKGSLIVNNEQIRFAKTGGILDPDTYTVTLRSATNGLKDTAGGLLDGNGDGSTGDDYIRAFTISPVAGPTVGIADFARGPGQIIQVPAPTDGIPISISDGSNVTSIDLTLHYDPSLLRITAVNPGAALPAGSTVQSDFSVAGTLTLHFDSLTPMSAGPLELVRLASAVPHTAGYGATGALEISGLSINSGGIAGIADSGVQAVAYFGDASANKGYSALDGSRILRVVAGLDGGFAGYPYLDPVLIADITGNGILSSLDGTRILQEVVGLDRTEIAAITADIQSQLSHDTGISATDLVTLDPTVTGTVRDDGVITGLMAQVDNGSFADVTSNLTSGSFSFNRAQLEGILGASLADGTHTLALQASDNSGNISTIADLTFTLDTVSPAMLQISPLSSPLPFYLPSIDVTFNERIDSSLLSTSGAHLTGSGPDLQIGTADDTSVAIGSLASRNGGTAISIIPSQILPEGNYRLMLDAAIISDRAGNHVAAPLVLDFAISDAHSDIGVPAIAQSPSANPGQTVGIAVPWGPLATRVAFPTADAAGNVSNVTLAPVIVDTVRNVAYFAVPANSITGNASVSVTGVNSFDELPNWNINDGSVDLFGTGLNDLLPGNGFYLDLDGTGNNAARLESKTAFDLLPGTYQLQFDIAGSQRGDTNTVTVSLGAAYSEAFTYASATAKTTVARTITVLAGQSAKLVFDHAGGDNNGLLLLTARLTRTDSGEILLDDNFDLPFSTGSFPLQIVPVVTGIDVTSVASDGSSAAVTLSGRGFVDGHGSIYKSGTQSISDPSGTTGPDVINNETQALLTVPLNSTSFGAITVQTEGGTSAPFTVGLTGLTAIALSGTAANSAVASANPGQAITITGTGLTTTTTDVIARYFDSNGVIKAALVSPVFASADGTSATLVLPAFINGTLPLEILGTTFSPQLQIVPVVDSADVNAANTVRLSGRGFIEGNNSTYRFNGVALTDIDTVTGPDVSAQSKENDTAQMTLPVAGSGILTVQTAGGTSAPIVWNAISPALGATLGDVAFNAASGELLVASSGTGRIHRINPVTGAELGNFAIPSGVTTSLGLDLLPVAITLRNTATGTNVAIPAGALLVFNGGATPNRIVAMDPITGAILATLDLSSNFSMAGGAVTITGRVLILDSAADLVREIAPTTGAEIVAGGFAVGMDINAGDIAIHPTTGNIWIGTNQTSDIAEFTSAGAFVRRLSLAQQSIVNEISGLAFDNSGRLLVSSTLGVVYTAELNVATPGAPTLTSINGLAAGGTAANAAQASANVGQVIELVGTNFRASDLQVQFATRSNAGVESFIAVAPIAVSTDGTRAQVLVPDLAETGIVKVNSVGSRNLGAFSGNDAIYRSITLDFVPSDATSRISFVVNGLFGAEWGLDNVSVAPKANPSSILFKDDFESGSKPEWLNSSIDNTFPGVFTQYYQGLTGQTQVLTLSGVTPGTTYQLKFDFYALDGWNGINGSGGPHFFDVYSDNAQLFHETFSNTQASLQSYGATGSVPLQIVPVLTGINNGWQGTDVIFFLTGSGFMAGASTIQLGGVLLSGQFTGVASNQEFGVSGSRNDTLRAVAPLAVEGPIRVTTAGGYSEIAGPVFTASSPAGFTGIQSVAQRGVPENTLIPSANTGQRITLTGLGLKSNTTGIQFSGADESGVPGTLTRSGVASTDGRTLTVEVPAEAVTGPVRVIGSDFVYTLQVVPTLRSVGGIIAPGNTVVLEGTGFSLNELQVQIDGIAATVQSFNTVLDGTELTTTDITRDQQLITVVVPAGVSAGIITVTTNGGTATIQTRVVLSQAAPLTFGTDVGDSIASAQAVTLPLNSQVDIDASAGIGDNAFLGRDVDMFRIDLNAGDRLIADIDAQSIGLSSLNSFLRLFNSIGTQLASNNDFGGSLDSLIDFKVTTTGTYYVGVSGSANSNYNPNFSNTGTLGSTGDYLLRLKRLDTNISTLTGITTAAASGTPAQAGSASANVGQIITLTGVGMKSGDQVVFTSIDTTGNSSGNLTSVTVAPTSIAADGTSLQVVVPSGAASGSVRLSGDTVGIFLQIVPTLTDVASTLNGTFHNAMLTLSGGGFVEGDVAVQFDIVVFTDSSRSSGIDVANATTINLTVPVGVPTGPIRVTTAGGTSAPFGMTVGSIVATASSGTPKQSNLPSANPGQAITIQGSGFDATTDVLFQTVDASGVVGERIVRPVAFNATQMTVIVPDDAITGVVKIIGAQNTVQSPLQIVPFITSLFVNASNQSLGIEGTLVGVKIVGKGFVEGHGSIYSFGSLSTVIGDVLGGQVSVNLPLIASAFGAITVQTEGGTSAPFNTAFTGLTAMALSGVPTDPALLSANAGQAITLSGTGFTTETGAFVNYYDSAGVIRVALARPTFVSADGTSAILVLPNFLNGVFSFRVLGSSFTPQLQIVPVVDSVDVSANTVSLRGWGFVEGNNSVYHFNNVAIADVNAVSGPEVSVVESVAVSSYVYMPLPIVGPGVLSVQTSGGTSAPITWNAISPVLSSVLGGVANNSTSNEVLVASTGTGRIHRINPATGADIGSFPIPLGGTVNPGLSITPVGITLRNTATGTNVAIPAGSLLVFNGGVTPSRIVAMDPITGTILATLDLSSNIAAAAGAVTSTGRIFLLDFNVKVVREIDSMTGAEIVAGSFATDLFINWGGIAIHPTTGNIWIGSTQSSDLFEYTPSGVLVRRVSMTPQSIAGEISGLAFDNTGTLLVASTYGVVYRINLDSGLTSSPTLTSINALAAGGTAANAAQASANVGQVVELVGTNFRASDLQVQFPMRNNAGVESYASAAPIFVSADGTRAQVQVPNLAETGIVKVTRVASQNLGGTGSPGGIYRNIQVNFVPTASTSRVSFTGVGLFGGNWGLDNVRVAPDATPSSLVFQDTFEGGANPGWSLPGTNNFTPGMFSQFSGVFLNQTQGITLSGLAPGQTYRLTFDVYILGFWDGLTSVDNGPDFFDVVIDNSRVFHESFSTNQATASNTRLQTYGAVGNVPLQIVPVISGIANRPGLDGTFSLNGSGFMEGATTVGIGGINLQDFFTNLDFDISGNLNDTLNLVVPLGIEGPIRVTTAGGYSEIPGPRFAPPAFVDFSGIQAVALRGTPTNQLTASANTGQKITLTGSAFTSSSLVQFASVDDAGVSGTLTRTGTASADGRTLTVEVPALAHTGVVKVVGDDAAFQLQVVPTLRSVGGAVAAGNTIILEGTGLTRGELSVRIDGILATVQSVKTIIDGTELSTSDVTRDQQLLTLVVPNGVGNGVITVTTNGGSSTIQAGVVPVQQSDIALTSDIGDTISTAQAIALTLNSRVNIDPSTGIGDNAFLDRDVDIFRVDLNAGDRLIADIDAQSIGLSTLNAFLRLFDATGAMLASNDDFGGSVDSLIDFTVAASGAYFIGVSGSGNGTYNPNAANSGSAGSTGDYVLKLTRLDSANSTTLVGITASANSGTAAQSGVPAANAGQTITITGSGLKTGDQVVFTGIDTNGNLTNITATPISIAADGTSLQVVVPTAAATGRVRLSGDTAGLFLQIVPTLADVTATSNGVFHNGALTLTGSGFVDGNVAIRFGNALLTDSGRSTGPDVTSATSISLTVPNGVSPGPIRVTTAGGTSAPFGLIVTQVLATATSGTPANGGLASANPGQTITIQGTGFDATTDIVFLTVDAFGSVTERVVRPLTFNAAQMTVVVPNDAITGTLNIIGDQSNSQIILQIVPVVTSMTVTSIASDGSTATVTLTGKGFIEAHDSIYIFGNQTIVDSNVSSQPDVLSSTQVTITVPLSAASSGPIIVRTEGGTSVPLTPGLP